MKERAYQGYLQSGLKKKKKGNDIYVDMTWVIGDTSNSVKEIVK